MSPKSNAARVAAVAVGLGIAMANGAAIAAAAPAETGTDTTAGSDTSTSTSTSTDETSPSTDTSTTTAPNEPRHNSGESATGPTDTETKDASADLDEDLSDLDDNKDETDTVAEPESASDDETERPSKTAQSGHHADSDHHQDAAEPTSEEDDEGTDIPVLDSDGPEPEYSFSRAQDVAIADGHSGAVDIINTVADPAATEVVVQPGTPFSRLSASLQDAIGGTAPAENPISVLFSGMFEFVRRTFFNSAPSVRPLQYGQLPSGQVIGTVGAVDPDGDPLIYTVRQDPRYGTVTVTADGTFTYTPAEGFAAVGGADRFDISVRQRGFHINLLNPFASTTRTVSIGVDVQPSGGVGVTTQGYTVWNFSSLPVTFQGHRESHPEVSGPGVGTVIQPGQPAHFEVTYFFFHDNAVTPIFTSDAGTWDVHMLVISNLTFHDALTCSSHSSGVSCAPENYGKDNAFLFDLPGTTITLPPDDPRQEAIVDLLCKDGATGKCQNFAISYQEETLTDPRIVGHIVKNTTPDDQTYAVAISDSVSSSDSLKIAAKQSFKILSDLINVEISEEYQHTWTNSHTFTETETLKIRSGYQAQIVAQEPIYRVHGDLTVTLGNTTWILKDVHFDSPNPNGAGVYTYESTPIPAGGSDDDEAPTGTSVEIISVNPDVPATWGALVTA
jgi:hypothetical protein